ncbi:MAG: hypothetical protein IKC10_01705 [Alphaproteobacteria bacterium]|nr:hypothetical protein [Alphaproteobacteria bacterium]
MDTLELIADSDIFGKTTENLGERTTFQPWHKPRKHWIRIHQWCSCVQELLAREEFSDISVLNYFGMPGEDCLDIQTIGQSLSNGKKIKYFGIEKSEMTQYQSIVESKLHDAPYISDDSKIYNKTQFEELDKEASKITNDIFLENPFHIINIDLTASLFPPSKGTTMWNALLRLLSYQFDMQPRTWLLFLTTRCDKASIDECFINEKFSVFLNNYQNENFRHIINTEIKKITNDDILEKEILLGNDCYEKIILLTIIKMILKNAVAKNVHMCTESVISYRIEETSCNPEMHSIVLRFTKEKNVSDATVAPYEETKKRMDAKEVDIASRSGHKVASCKNVDDILTEYPEIKSDMANKTKEMLKNIGYDITQYIYDR